MDDELYIVVYRSANGGRWKAISEGEFAERRLAENFIECKRASGWDARLWNFAIVEGPVVSPFDMAEAEARLGKF